ncbi:hypothetical protein ACTPOE_14795 [Castellaniella sp. WN]
MVPRFPSPSNILAYVGYGLESHVNNDLSTRETESRGTALGRIGGLPVGVGAPDGARAHAGSRTFRRPPVSVGLSLTVLETIGNGAARGLKERYRKIEANACLGALLNSMKICPNGEERHGQVENNLDRYAGCFEGRGGGALSCKMKHQLIEEHLGRLGDDEVEVLFGRLSESDGYSSIMLQANTIDEKRKNIGEAIKLALARHSFERIVADLNEWDGITPVTREKGRKLESSWSELIRKMDCVGSEEFGLYMDSILPGNNLKNPRWTGPESIRSTINAIDWNRVSPLERAPCRKFLGQLESRLRAEGERLARQCRDEVVEKTIRDRPDYSPSNPQHFREALASMVNDYERKFRAMQEARGVAMAEWMKAYWPQRIKNALEPANTRQANNGGLRQQIAARRADGVATLVPPLRRVALSQRLISRSA